MFSDLVGSTALSARMDPEDLREVISAYQKCVAETVRPLWRVRGEVHGRRRARVFRLSAGARGRCRAGGSGGAGVGRGGRRAQDPRAAANSRRHCYGLVVVGDLIGSGAAQEQAVVGETPNLAARLQGIAEPNTVVIAESTRKLLGNLFELEDLGAKDLKGIEGPAHAWAALRASSVESRFEALRTTTTPLVGRDELSGSGTFFLSRSAFMRVSRSCRWA